MPAIIKWISNRFPFKSTVLYDPLKGVLQFRPSFAKWGSDSCKEGAVTSLTECLKRGVRTDVGVTVTLHQLQASNVWRL